MKTYFAALRSAGNIVTVVMLTVELIRAAPDLNELHFDIVKQHVHRFMSLE